MKSKAIYGWKINQDLLVQYAADNQLGTCTGEYVEDKDGNVRVVSRLGEEDEEDYDTDEARTEYQCLCGDYCWGVDWLPKGVFLVIADNIYISLLEEGDSNLQEILTPELIQRGKEFTKMFVYDPDAVGDPQLMSCLLSLN